MRTPTRRRCLFACLAALLIPLSVLGGSACGSAMEAEASAASPQAAATSPTTLEAEGTLLVVRRQDAAWRLVRLTPATGGEQVIGALPFKPLQALASPSGARVLYVSGGRRLAVVEAATGAVQPVSLAGLPIRSIDGATWISEGRFLFGGSRRTDASPQYSSLYRADATTGKVTRFRRLSGGEPSYASNQGSLVYVTRRAVGDTAKETLWRLTSLTARPRVLSRASAYIDAGRSFDTPLLSPNAALVLNAVTGTDVSATYKLLDARWGYTDLSFRVQAVASATWGGGKCAMVGSRKFASGGPLVIFVFDVATGSLTALPTPQGDMVSSLAFSGTGDLAVGASWWPNSGVYAAAASDLGTWVNVGPGLVPVWVQ